MTTKTHLVIHHSATRDDRAVSWGAIRRYHTEVNRWIDIGYQFGVEQVGDYYEVLIGRPLYARAAAAYQRNMNRIGVHVCFVGNFDEAPPPPEMLVAAAPHLADVCEALSIPLDREHVIGHGEVAPPKTCPGKFFSVDDFVRLLRGM